MESQQAFEQELVSAWAPPEKISVTEWADRYRYLSSEASAEPGKYSSARAPFQRGMMEACVDRQHEIVVFMTSAQIGKTEVLNNFLGYLIDVNPGPVLVIQPTGDAARSWSKDRFAPMLRDTPVLRARVQDVRGIHTVDEEQTNTTLHKTFPGGSMTIGGANAVANFRMRTVRVFIGDDVDGWAPTVGDEGDQVTLGMKRTTTFWNRKTILASTPAEKATSRITRFYEESDQRKYQVPCPHCLHFQVLEWANLKWDKGENGEHLTDTAHFVCVNCRERIYERHKMWMLERGSWIADKLGRMVAGFWLWEAYSPWKPWSKLAAEFLLAKAGGVETLRSFTNVSLAQAWEGQGDAPEWQLLHQREELYQQWTIPHNVDFLTCGVDVQDDRIEATVWGWGPFEECWGIGHQILYGSTSEQEVYDQLDRFLLAPWPQPTRERSLHVVLTAMDSGYKKDAVYAFVRTRRERVMATKGSSERTAPIVTRPTPQDVNWQGHYFPGGVMLWSIGVSTAKQTLYDRLRNQKPGPRYVHFPHALGEEWYQQLTAEKLVTRFRQGQPYREWILTRPRNEALDCFVLAFAAAWVVGLPYMQWSSAPESEAAARPAPPAPPQRIVRNGGGLMKELLGR